MGRFRREPVHLVLDRAVRHIVAVPVRNKTQIGCLGHPYATVTPLDPERPLPLVPEHLALVKAAVPVGILEDHDAIPLPEVVLLLPRIRVALKHPETPPVVKSEGHRLAYVRLCGKECHLESIRHGHPRDLFQRRGRMLPGLLRILGVRPVVCPGHGQETE